jgi:flagellar biogenesis protein FliO
MLWLIIPFALCLLLAGIVSAQEPAAPDANEDLFAGAEDPLHDIPTFGWAFVKMLLVLGGILLGLFVLAKWVLPRIVRTPAVTGKSTLIEVLDVRRLEPRKNLYLVRVAGQCFLFATSEAGVQTLSGGTLDNEEVTAAIEAALGAKGSKGKHESSARPFKQVLEQSG